MIINGKNIQIFACSSGTGKTTFAKKNLNFIDLDKEKFFCKHPDIPRTIDDEQLEKLKCKVINKSKDYPKNYINLIKKYLAEDKNLLVVPEPLIMSIIEENDLPYVLIYPDITCKEEYKKRMMSRGNSKEFAGWFDMFYDRYFMDNENNTKACMKIKLQSGEFVEDAIKRLK